MRWRQVPARKAQGMPTVEQARRPQAPRKEATHFCMQCERLGMDYLCSVCGKGCREVSVVQRWGAIVGATSDRERRIARVVGWFAAALADAAERGPTLSVRRWAAVMLRAMAIYSAQQGLDGNDAEVMREEGEKMPKMFDPMDNALPTAVRVGEAKDLLAKLAENLPAIRRADPKSARFVDDMVAKLFDPMTDGAGQAVSEKQMVWIEKLAERFTP